MWHNDADDGENGSHSNDLINHNNSSHDDEFM
jgi:hypothetical protein